MHDQASSAGAKAIASLVLGMLGLVTWFCPLVGLPITAVGLGLGIKDLNGAYRGIAIAGAVLCAIGLVFSTLVSAIGAYLVVTGQLPHRQQPPDPIEWNNEPVPPASGSDPYKISTEQDDVLGPITVRTRRNDLLNVQPTYSLPRFNGQLTKEELETLKADPAVNNLSDALKVLEAQRDNIVGNFLRELLADGPLPEQRVVAESRKVSTPGSVVIPTTELDEARERLGIIRTKDLHWQLPDMPHAVPDSD